MPGSNNFLQWNPAAVNQQTDGTYSTDVMRTGGAVSGIFPAELANKLFFQCTTMVAAFGTALANKGYTISDASIATLITALANVLTKADFGTTAGTVCQGNDARFIVYIPSGTKAWFYQNTAPTGWTLDATPADAVLAVKGGSNAYNASGGTQAGTWTQPNHTHTGPSHTHTTGDVTLTAAQSGLPAHVHYVYGTGVHNEMYGGGGFAGDGNIAGANTQANSATAASEAHNHGATAASGTGSTGNGATAATWRPLAQVGIICTKD